MKMFDKFFERISTTVADFLPHLVLGIIVLILLRLISMVVYSALSKELSGRYRPGVVETVIRIAHYVVFTLAVIVVFETMGVSLTSLIALTGGLGVMVGYALAPYQSNIVAGLILLWDKNFKEGDKITVDGYTGHIKSISIRETKIATEDGKAIFLPNATILDGAVENYNELPHILTASFTLSPEIPQLRKVLETICDGILKAVPETTEAWPRLLGSDEVICDINIMVKLELNPERPAPDILSDVMFYINDYCADKGYAASQPPKLNVMR